MVGSPAAPTVRWHRHSGQQGTGDTKQLMWASGQQLSEVLSDTTGRKSLVYSASNKEGVLHLNGPFPGSAVLVLGMLG